MYVLNDIKKGTNRWNGCGTAKIDKFINILTINLLYENVLWLNVQMYD